MLNEVRDYLYENWKSVSVRANSIGSWFTLLAFQSKKVEQALLVSPILDMKKFIELMPQREDDYYEWVVNNPITGWDVPTYILRPEVDMIVSEEIDRDFISQLGGSLVKVSRLFMLNADPLQAGILSSRFFLNVNVGGLNES